MPREDTEVAKPEIAIHKAAKSRATTPKRAKTEVAKPETSTPEAAKPEAVIPTGQFESFRQNPVDGQVFKLLVEKSLVWLRTNQEVVNALNVYPVPDGDTGTNMVLTMQSAIDEVASLEDQNLGRIARSIAHGALMGARGNSGVILSQLWRGYARAFDDHYALNAQIMVKAFAEGRDTAYKGVVRPVEGTILTVAKDIAAETEQALNESNDLFTILEVAVSAADKSVQRTPDLLEAHKKAGVVDAGGKGLFFLLDGMLRYAQGLDLETPEKMVQPLRRLQVEQTMEVLEPGQDYEIVVDFKPFQPLNLEHFYSDLEKMGTSIQIGEGEGLYRMHIHVPKEKRNDPLDYIESLGVPQKWTVENLVAQMQEIKDMPTRAQHPLTAIEPGQIAVVAVSPGQGITDAFASFNATAVIPGGQTMNPSTGQFVQACEALNTDKIILLPNNGNVLKAANQAADLLNQDGVRQVVVVPTQTIPQGLAAMLRYIPEGDFAGMLNDMNAAIQEVQSGEITTAIRTAEVDGVRAKKGQFIALLNDKLVYSANNLQKACLGLLQKVDANNYGIVTLFYGAGLPPEKAERIGKTIHKKYPNLEKVEVLPGDQPHYQFIISIE